MNEIRPIPLDHFTSSLDGMAKINESISKALNSLEPNQHFAIIGIRGPKAAELTALVRINNEFSFAGFLKHTPDNPIDWGVSLRWTK